MCVRWALYQLNHILGPGLLYYGLSGMGPGFETGNGFGLDLILKDVIVSLIEAGKSRILWFTTRAVVGMGGGWLWLEFSSPN